MNFSRKRSIIFVTYTLAILFALCGFIYIQQRAIDTAEIQSEVSYTRAFSELADCMDGVSYGIKKAMCAASPSMMCSVLAEAYAKTAAAGQALGSLPESDIKLEHTSAFITKTGDYLFYLARNTAAGKPYTTDDIKNLRILSENADEVSRSLDLMRSRLMSGGISYAELMRIQNSIAASESELSAAGISDSVKSMETEFPEMPQLIYDGPFSAHISGLTPLLIQNSAQISAEEAVSTAEKYTGFAGFNVDCIRDGDFPVYVLSYTDETVSATAEVTEYGGAMLCFFIQHIADESRYSPEDCVNCAAEYLEKMGLLSMEPTYWTRQGGDILINFAFQDGDTVCYPDLIKIRVSLDHCLVTGYEGLGYIMCHTERDIPEPLVPADDAQSRLSGELTVTDRRSAVIPTAGKGEVFCHEFRCRYGNDGNCLVYVNALTGIEEKILILLQDENGTLTK